MSHDEACKIHICISKPSSGETKSFRADRECLIHFQFDDQFVCIKHSNDLVLEFSDDSKLVFIEYYDLLRLGNLPSVLKKDSVIPMHDFLNTPDFRKEDTKINSDDEFHSNLIEEILVLN